MIALTLAASLAMAASASAAPTDTTFQRLTKPALGETAEREIGDSLVVIENARREPGLRLTSGTQTKGPVGSRIVYGSTELHVREERRGVTFCAPAMMYPKLSFPVEFAEYCQTEEGLRKAGATFDRIEVVRIDPANFRQDLIYQGRSGSSIKISYREFAGDLARPAFTQELTFDLSDGPVVGVKGARIEVLQATNTSITYRLVQPFSSGPGTAQ